MAIQQFTAARDEIKVAFRLAPCFCRGCEIGNNHKLAKQSSDERTDGFVGLNHGERADAERASVLLVFVFCQRDAGGTLQAEGCNTCTALFVRREARKDFLR